ncbi:uncharacterized protein LOC134811894 isoform X2 [Bolinopsis microptera]|uniref:uncharacterized protein LOC134811894 isoform X2 n=1 Tax=Bolinopsis microptera TaxID=2820187 RepID=UPI003078DAF6
MKIPDVFIFADDESHPPQVVITNSDTNPCAQPLIVVSPESTPQSQPSCSRERDDSCPPQVVITNGENNPPQQPLIVVSAGSQHPSYPSHYRRDVRYSFDSADLLSPREKNISFWRANSLNSTFSTMDDDDEDDEELARLVDQIVVNVLSPPPTPPEENGFLSLPGSGNNYVKTPEPTMNSLQTSSPESSFEFRGLGPAPHPIRGPTPIPVPVDASGHPLGRYYLMSPSPTPASSTSSSSRSNSLSPGYQGSPRRFSLIPLTPDLRSLTPSDWSNQSSNITPSEIVLHPYLNDLSDAERQWVLMEHGRSVSTASLGSLTDVLTSGVLNGPDLPPIEFSQKEDFGSLAQCNMIGSCNADPSGRMCISIATCRVPINTTDWDRLLRFGLVQLDKICDNDYSLVYFHHGYDKLNKPSWKWLVTCYRSFDRKFKKNIKAFYIVHPSTKLKMVFRFMKPLVSIRASSKIVYCQRLSDLAQHVMLDRLDIPSEVKVHDKNLRARSVDNMTNTTGLANCGGKFDQGLSDIHAFSQPGYMRVFGGTLLDTDEVPQVISDCIDLLSLDKNITEEGLFRRCGNATELKAIKECYNTGQSIDLDNYCPHTIAAALKTYLRELSIPLLTFEAYPTISSWNEFTAETQLLLSKKLLESIPPVHYCCVRALMLFLNKVVSSSSQNLMTSQNLSIVIGPNLTWSRHTITTLADINNINSFTQYLIDNPVLFERETNNHVSGGAPTASVTS